MELRLEDYKVGWITALPTEAAAARTMLDEHHLRLPTPHDSNVYTFGHIRSGESVANGGHNIVIASGRPGTATAATIANDMHRTFPWLRIGLMVGIAGGIWSPDIDVRLGDVVVGVHPKGEAGVIYYDYGRQVKDKGFLKTGAMNKAPAILLNAVAAVQAEHRYTKASSRAYVTHLDRGLAKIDAARPLQDRLFHATYVHQEEGRSCHDCDTQQIRVRPVRGVHPTIPRVHYGPIASGNRLIRDAVFADEIRQNYGNLCFEMEAAGLDDFPSLTIRGITDYCDTHKNDDWHDYAAVAAAAYARELLSFISPTTVTQLPQLGNTLWNVPRAPNSLFTGRQALLDDMKKHLVTNSKNNDRPVFVLQGIGGAGKSETAIKFAMENRDSFWGIFWIDAHNERSIAQGFAEIANMQTSALVKTTPKDVLRWLSNNKKSWLLVLDNCDDRMIDFSAYMPSVGGSIILTTRLTACKNLGTWANLDSLGHDTATQLLLRACGYELGNQEAHMPAAKAVVHSLGQHALALVHAGAYIREGYCTLDQYVPSFQNQQNQLIRLGPIQQASRYGSVYATFEISAKALALSRTHDGHLALRLLDILAFLDRERVDEDIFSRASQECYELESALGLAWMENGIQWFQHCTIQSTENQPVANAQGLPDTLNLSEGNTKTVCGWSGAYPGIMRSESQHFTRSGAYEMTEIHNKRPVTKHRSHPDIIANDTNNEHLGPNTVGYEHNSNGCTDDSSNDHNELYSLDIWHCEKVRSSGLVEHQNGERHTITRFGIARACLAALSLIRVDNSTISMHPLVHEWARNRLDKTARQCAWEQTVSILALSSVQWHSITPRPLPHIDTCFRTHDDGESVPQLSLNVMRALYRLAEQSYLDRKYETSLSIFETLLASYGAKSHTWSHEIGALLCERSDCLSELGQHAEARRCALHLVQLTEEHHNKNSYEALESQLLLADITQRAEDYQAALSLLQSLYERHSQLSVAQMERLLSFLASVHGSLGNTEQAMGFAEKRFQLAEVDSPSSHGQLEALMKLCDRYVRFGQAEKAVTPLENAFKLYYNASPPNHCWVDLMITLAQAYVELKLPSKAMSYLGEARSHLAKLPIDPTQSEWLDSTLGTIGETYFNLGEIGLAATLFEERVSHEETYLPLDDCRRIMTLQELGLVYTKFEDSQKLKTGVMLLKEAIDNGRETFFTDLKQLKLTTDLLEATQEKLAWMERRQNLGVIIREKHPQEAATKRLASIVNADDLIAQQDPHSCADVARSRYDNHLSKKVKHGTMPDRPVEFDSSTVPMRDQIED